jgi:hypothetical protein
MGVGIRIWTLWRLRAGVTVSLALALLAAVWSVDRIGLAPPSLTSRSLQMASATTHVVVDTPESTLLDLRQSTYSFEALRNRAILLGNVIASTPVRQAIAHSAGIPVDVLEVSAPRTPEQPRAVVGSGAERHTTDIVESTDQYRLSIQANPTVAVLDIYAQSPDARTSAALANAAVDALRGHLSDLARSERTPAGDRIRLMQLGRATGTVINGGVAWQAAILAFLVTFGVSCSTVVFASRVREGWRLAALADRTATD